ncbi:hypothetical protein NQ314_008965 [Rhamnusium bicolor]|uniref:ZAD domain-containing protein n=1 Tax=Rhamnusium bicolor TaxID=1586634 RepID=A0AAV8Y778_9CUCU|nr:hypothetical protein NQ314_008965 [Rhamnusium bicolor]
MKIYIIIDLFLVCEPVICRNCFDDLENLFSFVTRCLDVEKSINIYRDTEGNNSSDKVNLYNVLQFTKIKKESNNDDEHKEEFVAENNFEKVFIKSENSHKTEDFDMNHEVFIKSEPREFEEESKHSVQTEDIEDKPKNQVFRR